jgi:hypothetical protein
MRLAYVLPIFLIVGCSGGNPDPAKKQEEGEKINATANQRRIEQVRKDLARIEKAIAAYSTSYDSYPANLDVLCVVDPNTGAKAALEYKHIMDPWNQRYNYEPQNVNPQTGRPRIYSNGVPGGGKTISNW